MTTEVRQEIPRKVRNQLKAGAVSVDELVDKVG